MSAPPPVILIVDDNPADILILERAVKKSKINAALQKVTDGEEAIAYLGGEGPYSDRAAHPIPWTIFLDLKLPKKSGFEVLQWVRERPQFQRISVFVISSSIVEKDISKVFELGGNSYLIKPVDEADLTSLLSQRILLIDDDPAWRLLILRELREELGTASFVQVFDMQSLQKALREQTFSLVVTDFRLRWATGLEVLRTIRKSWTTVPVIMFTGTGNEEVAVEAMKCGLDDYVLKSEKHLVRLRGAARRALARAEERRTLDEAVSRYHKLFENVPVGLFRCGTEGRFLDINPFLLTMLAAPGPEALTGKPLSEFFVDSVDRDAWNALLRGNGAGLSRTVRLRRLDGTTMWGRVELAKVRNDTGQALFCEGSVSDITDRMRAEERIKKAGQLEAALHRIDAQILEGADIREVMGTACEAIVEMGYRMCWIGQPDPDRIIRPVAYRGFTDGYPENIVIPLDDSSEGKGPTGTAIRTGQPCILQSTRESPIFGPWRESAIRHGYLSMAAFPLKSEEGEGIGVLDVYSDREEAFGDEEVVRLGMFAQQCSIAIINARRIESLRDANQRLAFHVNRMPLAYIVWDLEFGVVEWNPAAERIFGWKANEAIGKNAYELIILKEARSQFERGWSRLLKGDESSYSLNANVRQDGKIITCEWFNTLLHDASGNVSGVLSMAHDVTEKAEMEKQLQTAQRMEAVGTLAGGIAHDFNNALTGIFGFAEMVKINLSGNEAALADVNEILRCAERASTLTRQLLTYARRQVIEPVNLDLNKVITNLLKLVSKVTGEHIEILTFLAKDLPTIRADVGQIEQVVMNLILNARDAMPGGGKLLIETKLDRLDAEYVRHHPYITVGPHVMLTISDTGIGMDQKIQERVFDPFFTTKAPDQGTGLGLAVVYGIIKQHSGSIHLYSEPGKGTTFKVYLPPVEAPPDEVVLSKSSEIRGGIETLLLAEDDESVRTLVERTLTDLGYTVLIARNGKEAVEAFQKNGERIDLALLDVVMPKMGGKEAYEEMRKERTNLKVIFMSGYTANAVHESFILTAGIPFLSKPFGPGPLARKVREVLDAK
jgi:PAS domain S-box-containing protein